MRSIATGVGLIAANVSAVLVIGYWTTYAILYWLEFLVWTTK